MFYFIIKFTQAYLFFEVPPWTHKLDSTLKFEVETATTPFKDKNPLLCHVPSTETPISFAPSFFTSSMAADIFASATVFAVSQIL